MLSSNKIKKKLTPSFTYHINDAPIKAVPHAKCLEVTIESKLMQKEHIKITIHKLKQTQHWHSYVYETLLSLYQIKMLFRNH